MSAFLRGEQAYTLDAGFQACLPKPFTPERLLETILTVLRDQ
jgi:CheY-like chemotaxis protein